MRQSKIFLALLLMQTSFHCLGHAAPITEREYLSGRGPSDAVEWEFFCTEGRRSGTWTTIPVPSHWEQHGFGSYNYGHDKDKSREQGLYRRRFVTRPEWKGKRVRIVFDGVMTDAQVKINGQSAGEAHQGGFTRFFYEISDLLKPAGQENLLEVEVSKVSANDLLEQAERKGDYWVFGGIYRPVYLEILPEQFIDWTAIDARADGEFRARIYPDAPANADRVVAQIETLEGQPVGDVFSAPISPSEEFVELSTVMDSPQLWTAETPHLYRVRFRLMAGDEVLHEVVERFGFRTFEVRRGEGLFINGRRIFLKGVNRHCFRPDTGRALDREESYEDARLIKSMNMNAVRCAHYVPDKDFLEACDELGLYVINERCNWQKPAVDTATGTRSVYEIVRRDVNHPSILIWANGNEGGNNEELDPVFTQWDIQQRPVIWPWETRSGLDTKHYLPYDTFAKKLQWKTVFLPTEFLHGLYDGGLGAGLADYWKAMTSSVAGGGGFLWVFADEGLLRTDKDGAIDTDGNHAPDGILGPYHEKEGSYYAIREIWSPIELSLADDRETAPAVTVQNGYDFRSLKDVRFQWQWLQYPTAGRAEDVIVLEEGTLDGLDLAPGESGQLLVPKPPSAAAAHALRIRATDWNGIEIGEWSWPLIPRQQLLAATLPASEKSQTPIKVTTSDAHYQVQVGNTVYHFSADTGWLEGVTLANKTLPLSHGPRFLFAKEEAEGKETPAPAEAVGSPTVKAGERSDGNWQLTAEHPAEGFRFAWTVQTDGQLRLTYSIHPAEGHYNYAGIAFDLPGTKVLSKTWLGDGPYRVWKNRTAGPMHGIWHNNFNEGIAGEVWELPEFQGIFQDVHWMRLNSEAGSLTLAIPEQATPPYVGVLRPPNGQRPARATFSYPETGELFFFHAIPGIGTKFYEAKKLGPHGEPTHLDQPITGEVLFRFLLPECRLERDSV